ncbi:YggT family protein [Lonepinella sp. BR2357]|uniref:YggT family protein n=1 Tax=Lonepinella sp. BR2357 TaxID=3434549 RepID=UPI003F6E06C1
MNSIQYLVNSLLGVYMLVVMLRMWLQYCKADFYNPISQAVVKLTDPVLNPIRKTFKAYKNIDIAALLFVFLLGLIKYPLLAILGGTWSFDTVAANVGLFALIGVLTLLKIFGEMILYVIFIGAVLSWFRRGNDPLAYLLYQLGEPVLSPIRRLLPKTGMIDFSPMILAFVLFWLDKVMYDIVPFGLWKIV